MTYTTGSQFFPSIATDNNGNFIISWYGPGNVDLLVMEYSLKDILLNKIHTLMIF
jgi:hypothetical protein